MDRSTQLSLHMDRLQLLHHALLRKSMSTLGLWRGQPPILEYVLNHEGCTQANLARDMGLSPASVAISTKRLVKAGLLEKSVDGGNLRCNQLKLTAQGKEKTEASWNNIEEVNRKMFSGFSEAEQEDFLEYLDRMIRNLGGEPGDFELIENFILANKLHGKAK